MKTKGFHFAAVLFILFSIFSYFDTFQGLENKLQDSLLQSEKEEDGRIMIVGIDDQSLEQLGRWPWSRENHAKLIDLISQGEPAAIGLDLILSEPAQSPQEDLPLIQSIKNSQKVVLPVYGTFNETTRKKEMKVTQLAEPFPQLKAGAVLGHINTIPDPDGIVRKTVAYYDYEGQKIESFAWKLYNLYLKNSGEQAQLADVPLDDWNRMQIDFTGGPGKFPYLSYNDVLNGELPSEYLKECFKDKIVLVGPYTVGIEDYYFTPLEPQSPMFGVEIHANIIQNLLNGNLKRPAPYPFNLLVLILLTVIGFYCFNKLKPAKALLVLLGLIAIYLFSAVGLYKKGFILLIFYPLTLLVLNYLAALAYRYLQEMLERKRVTDVFGRYVAPQVVNKILQEGEEGLKLGGNRREITALFVDIRGFTPLSEIIRPEEVVEILNDYLSLCAESIFKFGGTLDKFIGDAAMAIFNAPLELEEHAYQAVQTAWAMKEGSSELQRILEERFGRSVQFGIGINTGEAVVGNIGAEVRMDYTAIGDTVNTAARLESNAKAGQILLSQSTYEKVKNRVKAAFLGEIKVKGKVQGVPVYELEGLI